MSDIIEALVVLCMNQMIPGPPGHDTETEGRDNQLLELGISSEKAEERNV
jgi:hypothetical protein